MPTHLYCLLPRESSATPPAAVRVVDAGVGLAWVASTDNTRLSRDAREVVRATVEHDGVVGLALGQGVTPMPASLADPYDDDSALVADVATHAYLLERAFLAIAGMVEMTAIIAVSDAPPAADAPGRGKAYLEQIRSAPARVGAIADRIAGSLSRIIPDSRRRDDGNRVALSYLLPRTAEPVFRAAIQNLSGDGYRIVIDGPRAPYSFALFSPRHGLMTEMWLGDGTILAT
jgi:hypothetical protein